MIIGSVWCGVVVWCCGGWVLLNLNLWCGIASLAMKASIPDRCLHNGKKALVGANEISPAAE